MTINGVQLVAGKTQTFHCDGVRGDNTERVGVIDRFGTNKDGVQYVVVWQQDRKDGNIQGVYRTYHVKDCANIRIRG